MNRILKFVFIWKFWLVLVVFAATVLLPFRDRQVFTTLLHDHNLSGITATNWVYPWANFDGVHYLNIAQRGYEGEGRFLPLYPLVIATFTKPLTLFFGNEIASFFWVSQTLQLFIIGAILYVFHKLVQLDISAAVQKKAILLFASFPTAFFLFASYSEGLFVLLSLLSIFFARKKKWGFAILSASLLSITRLSGVLILFPLLIELYLQQRKNFNSKKFIQKAAHLLWIPVLLLIYAFYNYQQWGDWLYFVHAHGDLGNSREVSGVVFPLVTVYRYVKILLAVSPHIYEFWVALLELLTLMYASILMIGAYLKKLRPTYQVYSLVMILLPLFSGTLSGLPRYVLPLFPLFIVQAMTVEKRPRLFWSTVVLGFVLQAVLLALFAQRYYIS